MGYRCNWCGKEFSHNPIIANAKVREVNIQLYFCCDNCYPQGMLAFSLEFGAFSEEEALQHLVNKLVLRKDA